jgi:hypothetical protein
MCDEGRRKELSIPKNRPLRTDGAGEGKLSLFQKTILSCLSNKNYNYFHFKFFDKIC